MRRTTTRGTEAGKRRSEVAALGAGDPRESWRVRKDFLNLFGPYYAEADRIEPDSRRTGPAY